VGVNRLQVTWGIADVYH